MKIKSLKIRGFRGIDEKVEILFASGLNLIYAPNGWGKSSIAEAIEWAIYGNTQRKLDAKSKIEFEGTYRNVHIEPSVISSVEMTCEKENQEIIIKRKMGATEETEFSIFPESESHIVNIPVRPIIYQHGLQRFIHTEPSKRWDEFANILGLNELENLRDILMKVKNNKDEAIPEEVKENILKLSNIRYTIDNLSQLQDLKKPAHKSVDKFIMATTKLAEELVITEQGNKDDIINELKNILKKRKTAIFDLSIFSMRILDQVTLQQYEDDKKYISNFCTKALDKIKEYREQKRGEQDIKHLAFIKQGLDLLPEGVKICPFCGESTISSELRVKLTENVKESSKTSELHQKILKAIEQMSLKITNLADPFIKRLANAATIQGKIPKIFVLFHGSS